MRDPKRTRARALASLGAVAILALGLTPLGASAADHLDSPSVKQVGAADINDVYVFNPGSNRTAIAVTVNPGAGVLPHSTRYFGPGVKYEIKVDTNGDVKPDVRYTLRFAAPVNGQQSYTLWRNGIVQATGRTGRSIGLPGAGAVWAGLRDDPFFFDLAAFQGAVLGTGNGRSFCDGKQVNFFKGLNVSAIVLMVPNASLGGWGRNIGVWSTTSLRRFGEWVQFDQMGRPAINTVFNSTNSDKELFNRTQPGEQPSLGFRTNVANVLKALSALSGAAYTDAQANAYARVLIPDVLTFKTGDFSGFLNGRRLRDDVIDAELGIVTKGAISSDCIGNDSAFSSTFPFLAPPN